MSNYSRFGLNVLLIIILAFVLFSYMFKDHSVISDENKNFVRPRANPEENFIRIPLEEIMVGPVTLKADDPLLIKKIRTTYLWPPSEEPYNLKDKSGDPSKGQSLKIMELLNNKKNGFFVECGALDGETRSNTLVFEKSLGWKGVLIEGDPSNFDYVIKKNRKAWSVNACLSTEAYPNSVMFSQSFNTGKITNISVSSYHSPRKNLVKVQCLPIYSILLALNVTKVDYFSLDVEGHELEVLRTIPWTKVNITTLSVEYIHGKEGKDALKKYMESKGYIVYTEVRFPGGLANDFIFYHPVLLSKA